MTDRVRLIEVASVIRGRVPAKTVSNGTGPPFFGIAEISSRGTRAQRYPEPGVDLEGAPTLTEGDIVVALLSNPGMSTRVGIDHTGAVLGRECAAVRVTKLAQVLSAWVYAWTQSEDFLGQVRLHVSGMTMPRLPINELTDFTLPIPSRVQQERVEELVGRFDSAIAATATALRDLEELRSLKIQLALATKEDQ